MHIPKGFQYAGVAAGLKSEGKKDMGLIVSELPAVAAGVTTTNQACAACVQHARKVLFWQGKAKAIVVNTKFANACTGKEGLADNKAMAEQVKKIFGGPVLTASTGIIGQRMPLEKIKAGVDSFKDSLKKTADDFAAAILTTDLTIKQTSKMIVINGQEVIIHGAAKGSGMIHPNMATMLAFITTDAKISRGALQKMVKAATNASFNQITVDGDTSTNDMVLCLANGFSGAQIDSKNKAVFQAALDEVLIYLAKEIARDGEGATKLVEVRVKNARTVKDARLIARTVCGSPLVKCAIYGGDNNWGRVIAAVGRAGVKINPDKVKMNWTGLKTKEVLVEIDLGLGQASGSAWGCDLTEGYIKINTNYN
jgi:glutamate N-acetyltransferase/amino-acid N-acetyltransferase